MNLKSVLDQQRLETKEKNKIIMLHNEASNTEAYGQDLYKHCVALEQQGKAEQGFADKIYVLSVDWPLDFLMDPVRD